MGTSTNAYLFYGIELGDESEAREALGMDTDDDSDGEELTDVLEYIEAKLEKAGLVHIEVNSHCHGDDPMFFFAAKVHTAWRGSPEALELSDLVPLDLWNKELKKAMEVLNLDYVEPKWVLASYWG